MDDCPEGDDCELLTTPAEPCPGCEEDEENCTCGEDDDIEATEDCIGDDGGCINPLYPHMEDECYTAEQMEAQSEQEANANTEDERRRTE